MGWPGKVPCRWKLLLAFQPFEALIQFQVAVSFGFIPGSFRIISLARQFSKNRFAAKFVLRVGKNTENRRPFFSHKTRKPFWPQNKYQN